MNIEKYCASMKNPPKGYGSMNKGIEVIAYRSSRLKFHANKLGSDYTPKVRRLAEEDVVKKFGLPS